MAKRKKKKKVKGEARLLKRLKIKKVKGRTARGLKMDAKRKALPPGIRRSKYGKKYKEVRDNRSDRGEYL